MRRHVLIGRFGADDKTRVPKARDEVASTLQLVAGKRLDHGIGRALDDLKALSLSPSEIGADLLVVAAHVHAADTRLSRSSELQDAWTREIRFGHPGQRSRPMDGGDPDTRSGVKLPYRRSVGGWVPETTESVQDDRAGLRANSAVAPV